MSKYKLHQRWFYSFCVCNYHMSCFLKIQMLIAATVPKPSSPELRWAEYWGHTQTNNSFCLYAIVVVCQDQRLLRLGCGCLMSIMYVFTPTVRIILPWQYCMNREEWIELLWQLCGRALVGLGGLRAKQYLTAASAALTEREKSEIKRGFVGTKKRETWKKSRSRREAP